MEPRFTKAIRVMLADDHPVVMTGFAAALKDHGIDVVGLAGTPEDAIETYRNLSPDVAILDIRFGEKLTGLDAAKEILKKFPVAKIIFLSQFDQDSLIKETYRLGGRAFITKGCDGLLLATAVKQVQDGKLYFLPQVAERLANLAIRGEVSPQSQLKDREMEIFTYMAQGLTIHEIAEKLDLSLRTISTISQTVKEKLGIHRAADATKLAIKHGLIEP